MWKYYTSILKDGLYKSEFEFNDLYILAILEPQLWAEFITSDKLKNTKKVLSDCIKSEFSMITEFIKNPRENSKVPATSGTVFVGGRG